MVAAETTANDPEYAYGQYMSICLQTTLRTDLAEFDSNFAADISTMIRILIM